MDTIRTAAKSTINIAIFECGCKVWIDADTDNPLEPSIEHCPSHSPTVAAGDTTNALVQLVQTQNTYINELVEYMTKSFASD